jgi:hypothetical protein
MAEERSICRDVLHKKERRQIMFRTIVMKSGALALLLATSVVGNAEAQPPAPPSGYCTGGLSTLTGSFARFHLALDDDSTEPGIFVVMRFFNQAGALLKSKTANIGPGGSATLEYRVTGVTNVLYRVQADIFEPSGNVNRSARRSYVGSGEAEVALYDANTIVAYRLIGPGPMKVPCTPAVHQLQ